MSLGNPWTSIFGRIAVAVAGGAMLAGALFAALPTQGSAETAVTLPEPKLSQSGSAGASLETAVLAGGCFWGVQGVFQHLNGVTNAVSGYAGGAADTAHYETVGSAETGHAESVQITFDPNVVSYGKILQVYFSVAHDPTQLNRQGPDIGTQYRSTIFPANDGQRQVAEAYIAQLNAAKVFGAPIATTVELAKMFYPAEAYHQDYATLHPDSPYIATFDLPKIDNLSRLFPDLYRQKPRLVADQAASN
jgi:peptide-methionine (S)-S-oxide reductase